MERVVNTFDLKQNAINAARKRQIANPRRTYYVRATRVGVRRAPMYQIVEVS